MCHCSRMRDERLYAAETFTERTKLDVVQNLFCIVQRTRLKRDHTAEPTLLSTRYLILRVRDQAGIKDLLHFRMLSQEICHLTSIAIVSFHSNGKSLGSTQNEERIEW